MSLTLLEPVRFTGDWQGYEIGDQLAHAPLSLGGVRYESGPGTFAGSEIEFDLKGLYGTFSALAGVDAGSKNQSAAVEFVVLGDDHELWRSGLLQATDAPEPVEVHIAGVHKLVLRTSGISREGDHLQADWAEPNVSKSNR